MIAGSKPYSPTKDSGVSWLGTVPEHWEVRKLRHLLSRLTERNRPDLPLLSVVRERGVILRDRTETDENRNFVPDDLSNYKVVRAGQFAMNKMKAWQGSYGVSSHNGIVSPAYFVFDLTGVEGHFFHAAIRSKAYVPFFTQASDGVRIGQWDLVEARMREIPFLVPPTSEQSAIVGFLGHVDRRIRRYVNAKQKLIKLLEEQKRAIIHRTVTRGLDANVRLKPSGVDWLGDVPDHWDVEPLRRYWSVTDCKHVTVPYVEEGVPLASVREVQSFDLNLTAARKTTWEWYEFLIEGDRQPKRGDLVYCRNVSVGATAYVETSERFAMGQDVCLIRSERQSQRYLNYFLHSHAIDQQMAALQIGSTFNRINVADIKNLVIAIPPRKEQDAIAGELDVVLHNTDKSTHIAKSQIELIREFQTRLVADVVTGKLDVREASSRLPDESEESDPFDEPDEVTEAEDADVYDPDPELEEAEA